MREHGTGARIASTSSATTEDSARQQPPDLGAIPLVGREASTIGRIGRASVPLRLVTRRRDLGVAGEAAPATTAPANTQARASFVDMTAVEVRRRALRLWDQWQPSRPPAGQHP
jgi:hypothetical protein